METGPLITIQRDARAIYAAGLLTALLAALLGAWFFTGWRDVQQRQREATRTPYAAADRRAHDLARELNAELEALLARETRRPYFHYQNLIHDPQMSAGLNVSPSPLARGPEDKFVLGYFQLDSAGRATTPTINDEVPALSERQRLADNRAFRNAVVSDLSRDLAPPRTKPEMKRTPSPQPPVVITVDPSVYAQNINPNAVYAQQSQMGRRPPEQTVPIPPLEAIATRRTPVTITISPLQWRTLRFGGQPSLLATRQVHTPDGALAQGFVVDRAALTSWLATKAGGMVVELHPDDSRGAAIAPGWSLAIEPDPHALAQAARNADGVARAFLMRFVGTGSMAVLVAGFVVVLVTRAEKLARERSQFAAAAAHELRTPLAGLQLYGDMLAEGLGDPAKVREYARHVSEDAARLGRVVTNMLGFSQLERGDLRVDAHVGPFGDLLLELAERARPALGRAGAALEIDVAPDLRARFDRDAVARIVGNLLDNAEKYSRGADNRTIRLSALHRGNIVEVSVEDRGPGVTDRATLFRAFSRGVSGGDSPPGLGLGLALSISLARAMAGDLTYAPREGGGARFVLQLPSA